MLKVLGCEIQDDVQDHKHDIQDHILYGNSQSVLTNVAMGS